MRQPPPPPHEDVQRPLVCPDCGSTDVTAPGKHVTADTYWHCGKCGEVWNAGRRQETSRYGFIRRPQPRY